MRKGVGVPVEIERKFLLSHAPDWSVEYLRTADLLEIEQVYLKVGNGTEERIRRTSKSGCETYHLTRLASYRPGVRDVHESEITAREFHLLRQLGDPLRKTVRKRRRVFQVGRHVFELDEIYEPASRACCILEVQLSMEDEPVDLPESIPMDREVTAEASYANSNIALG
jgi:CYTH domain-containing protein